MTKLTKVLALVLVAAMLCIALASCGKTLSGTYTAEVIGTGASYTFKGSKVTITAKVFGFEKTFDGKYEIYEEDGAEKIKFTFEDDDAEEYAGSFSFSEGDGYIKIGGIKYTKAK
jgi:uncharacterized lipoprotein YehR (DUF1307 family)